CLKMARSHVYAIIDAFARDGFAGLEDQRTQPPPHLDTQLTLPFLKEVLDLQQAYPRAGRFRIHGLLAQQHGPDLPSEATGGPWPLIGVCMGLPVPGSAPGTRQR